jgi:hypothetical protein
MQCSSWPRNRWSMAGVRLLTVQNSIVRACPSILSGSVYLLVRVGFSLTTMCASFVCRAKLMCTRTTLTVCIGAFLPIFRVRLTVPSQEVSFVMTNSVEYRLLTTFCVRWLRRMSKASGFSEPTSAITTGLSEDVIVQISSRVSCVDWHARNLM